MVDSANPDTRSKPGPIRILFKNSAPAPVVYAALGAAASFYGYPLIISVTNWGNLLLVFVCLVIAAASFLRVLANSSFLFLPEKDKNEIPAIIPKINLVLLACVTGICLGLSARAGIAAVNIPLPLSGVNTLTGILQDDPRAFNDGRGMGSLQLSRASNIDGVQASAKGNVTVFFPVPAIPRLKEFGRGSEIHVEGNLIFTDRGYLFRASQVHILKPAPVPEQFRTGFRTMVMEKFGILQDDETIPPVWAGLASAMLLGIRDDLDTGLTSSFNSAGCSHVLSLSGMHLAVLSGIIVLVLRLFLGVRPASAIGAIFIVIYIFLAGSQPSLVRSGIIYLLGTISLWGYLKKNPLSLLAMAFLVQLVFQSESGLTVSFLLSYLAMAGILVSGQSFYEMLRGRIPDIILAGLSASIGAFIATAGITAFYFGELHPVGILAGLFIMPLASLFMVLAFGSLILICIIPVLFGPINFILTTVYRLLEFLVTLAGKTPGIKTPSFMPVLIISVFIIALLEFLKYRDSNYRRSIASFDTGL